jgi:ech hydrogenase subunit D
MFEKQVIENIKKDELLERVATFAKEGYRLVQISCTRLDKLVVDYSFDKDYKFHNLRFELPLEGAELPSISDIYFASFTYENELHDLFGINVSGINIDFGGKFYRINEERPFNKPVTKSQEA